MGTTRINIRFFLWHLQVSKNWKFSWIRNDAHKGFPDGWFAVYDFKILK